MLLKICDPIQALSRHLTPRNQYCPRRPTQATCPVLPKAFGGPCGCERGRTAAVSFVYDLYLE